MKAKAFSSPIQKLQIRQSVSVSETKVEVESSLNGKKRRASSMNGLSGTQIKELEQKLQSLRAELLRMIGEKTDSVVNTAALAESLIKGDDAEVAEKQRENNSTLQELDILKNRLSLVSRALHKIQRGNYGLCEESEEEIGFERLLVVPWARYCVNVQEKREKKLKEFRGSRLRAEA